MTTTTTTPTTTDPTLAQALAEGMADHLRATLRPPLERELADGTPCWEARLAPEWLPAMGDATNRLDYGGTIAAVGPAHTRTGRILARTYPLADVHDAVLPTALPQGSYDLIALLECLHDQADPPAVAGWAAQALTPTGALMVVDPVATLATAGTCAMLEQAGLTHVGVVAATPLHGVVRACGPG